MGMMEASGIAGKDLLETMTAQGAVLADPCDCR